MNKDIKYIVKRVIIGVLVGVILFSLKSCNVKALTNTPIGQDVEFPTGNATFISMNNSNYGYTNGGYRYFYGTMNPNLYMAAPTNQTMTCGTYGCGINIDGLSVIKNNYYSITIYYLGYNSPYIHYSYSSLEKKVGISNGYSTIDIDYWVTPTSGTTNLSRSCNSLYDNEYTGNCLFQWTLIFKAPRSGTSLQTIWSSNPSGASPSDRIFFVGYTFKYIGDSSLTPEQLQSALTNATTDINNNNNQNTQSIINNQNSNTQQIISEQENTTDAINDLNDTMKDDNIDNTESNSFFNNFQDNTHGLSGIITAPLSVIQNLVNVSPTSCQDLTITYHEKTITMPCGKIFWGHEGFNPLNDFFNLVVGGMFAYLIIKNLFLMIEQLKNPDNDKVEVMDL